ncbi:MAG: alpha-glucan phosphorylase, partial [Clostridia bacterium]|nr:alpha-glucan phosphorylase [Clostridia bacterium]
MNSNAKEFKEKMEQYIELNFGCDLNSAGKRQIYQAVLGVTNEILAKKRYAFSKKTKEKEAKQVFYMSMEFLVGTSLRNNLWNLGIEDDIKNMLKENN